MARASRKTCREALGTLLTNNIVGANKAQAVYDHLKEDFEGASPVVCVASAGFKPKQLHFGDDIDANWGGEYSFNILTFVAREDEEVSEDALDNVIEAIFDVLANNREATNWKDIEFGESGIDTYPVGGDPYWVEMFPITVYSY